MNLIFLRISPTQITTTNVPVEIENILELIYGLYRVSKIHNGRFEMLDGIDLKTPSNVNITTDTRLVMVRFDPYGFVPGYYGVSILINDIYTSSTPQKQIDIVYKIEVYP